MRKGPSVCTDKNTWPFPLHEFSKFLEYVSETWGHCCDRKHLIDHEMVTQTCKSKQYKELFRFGEYWTAPPPSTPTPKSSTFCRCVFCKYIILHFRIFDIWQHQSILESTHHVMRNLKWSVSICICHVIWQTDACSILDLLLHMYLYIKANHVYEDITSWTCSYEADLLGFRVTFAL